MPSRPSQGLNEIRLIIKQILADHSQVYQGGDSFLNFEEQGPHRVGGLPLNSAYIRRYFQNRPQDVKSIRSRFLDKAEAETHLLIEGKLRELRSHLPNLVEPVDAIHFRSTAGTRDADWYLALWERLSEKGDWQAHSLLWRYHRCVDTLAQWFKQEQDLGHCPDLYATFVQRKSLRDADKKQDQYEVLYSRFKALTMDQEMTPGEAFDTLGADTGLSTRRLREIMADRREFHGDEPARAGRPPKKRRIRGRRK